MGATNTNWVTIPRPNPQAKTRLYCFTYAGGGTAYFSQWIPSLPLTIELCPIRLPGRESRLRERPYTRIHEAVPALVEAMRPVWGGQPFAFYGHSMGGIVAFETARQLRRLGLPQPKAFFVSGCRAPHIPDPNPPFHPLPDGEFIQSVGKLNGTPAAVMENKELLALLLPVLRADFEAIETYRYSEEAPLDCSITAIGGDNDPKALVRNVAAWEEHTTGTFDHHTLEGDHFFIQQEPFLSLFGQLLRHL